MDAKTVEWRNAKEKKKTFYIEISFWFLFYQFKTFLSLNQILNQIFF